MWQQRFFAFSLRLIVGTGKRTFALLPMSFGAAKTMEKPEINRLSVLLPYKRENPYYTVETSHSKPFSLFVMRNTAPSDSSIALPFGTSLPDGDVIPSAA